MVRHMELWKMAGCFETSDLRNELLRVDGYATFILTSITRVSMSADTTYAVNALYTRRLSRTLSHAPAQLLLDSPTLVRCLKLYCCP